MKKYLFYVLVAWGVLSQYACSDLKEKDPVLPVDTATVSMPALSILVKEDSSVSLDLSTILPQNEPYTLQFGALLHGEILVENGGKQLRYKSTSTGWKSDSTGYEFCRKGRCRNGIFKVNNLDFIPIIIDPIIPETLALAPIGPFYLEFLSSFEDTIVPLNISGKLISLTHNYYIANIQGPDSTRILYFSAGGGTVGTYGFDDITYIIKASNGKLYKGGFEMILGDTCEAQARNDSFSVTGNSMTWPASNWFENDQPCFGTEDNYQIRISLATYGTDLTINTGKGLLTDTMEAGIQKLKYTRTNLSATEDSFWYYVKAGFNQRITRAKVKLKFQ